ncbi:Protein arginine N-methyltransferase 3 [Phlyctochytrium planicorne]|nr:Protein arginine N-methyltransferase 3 [Phlyctochytrium planicorne]
MCVFGMGLKLTRKAAKENVLKTIPAAITEIIEDDGLLQSQLENDPLLYDLDFDDFGDDTDELDSGVAKLELNDPAAAHEALKLKYAQLEKAFLDFKELVKEKFFDTEKERNIPVQENEALDSYFVSYGGADIHEVMIKDAIRTDSYRDFMYLNKDIFKDKIVLDVGCGTGILSLFAAKSGAKMVYAVDNSEFIKKAIQIAKDNKLDHKITFIRGSVETVNLPVDSVDIIISEWMGYFLLFEGMFDSVISARDRWLAKDGIMAPSHAEMFLAAMEGTDWINDRIAFWNDVYGFNMACVKDELLTEGQVDFIYGDSILSNAASIKTLDLEDITVPELDFTTTVDFKMLRTGKLTSLCGWFDISFQAEGATTVFFSTGPFTKQTHWKQTVFVLTRSIDVVEGEVVSCKVDVRKSQDHSRDLVVKLDLSFADASKNASQSFHVR